MEMILLVRYCRVDRFDTSFVCIFLSNDEYLVIISKLTLSSLSIFFRLTGAPPGSIFIENETTGLIQYQVLESKLKQAGTERPGRKKSWKQTEAQGILLRRNTPS